MADNFDLANDAVIESGYKKTEEHTLVSGATTATPPPTSASQGQALSGSSRGILIAWSSASGTSFDILMWGYFGTTIGWRRISELDKLGVSDAGEAWKSNIGGMSRLYAQIDNFGGAGNANVSLLRAYA